MRFKLPTSTDWPLADGDIRNGMRTTRCLSQIVWSYYEEYLIDQMREACDQLMKSGGTSVLPVIRPGERSPTRFAALNG